VPRLALALLLAAATQLAVAQPRSFTMPAGLVADGIPAIPASIAGEVGRYTEFRGTGFADWHPTSREMLVSMRAGNVSQIHRVGAPGGAREQLTSQNEPLTTASYDRRGGSYFLFLKDVGGNEFSQIYRQDFASKEATLLTDGGRSQNGDIRWSTRGDRIVYSSTRRNGADRDLYVMDPAKPETQRMLLQVQGGGWTPLDWSPDGKTLLVTEYRSVNESMLWLVDTGTAARRLLVPRAAGDSIAMRTGRFSGDGRSVYATSDQHGEFAELVRIGLETGAIQRLSSDIPWSVTALEVSADGRFVAFTTNEAGLSRLYFLNTGTGAATRVEGLPNGVITEIEWHRRLPELALTVQSARSPGDVYSVNAIDRAVTRWTESELGGIAAGSLREPELVAWQSFDKRQISGWHYRPAARFTGRRPVIVNIHGGPEAQARPTFIGRNNYFLNELGVSIIYPNVRGSTGFGKIFVRLDNGVQREDSVRDIAALFDWIATRPDLDASRILVIGGSYGGYMTLMVATMYAERICCAVDVVGMSNLATFLQNTESYRRDLRRVEYGDERVPAIRAWMERTAAVNNAHKIVKPLFVVQGANDPRVPRTEAEQIVAAARKNATPVWYLLGANEGHGFRKKENVDAQFYAMVYFARQFLVAQPP
jgi:dipeptidyl aminopeptidase/acylaminoacyl peptidase